MAEIIVSRPGQEELEALGVSSWGVWQKEASTFPWSYDAEEVCYLLQGEVEVTAASGQLVRFKAGDMVVFPAGLSCQWNIIADVKKHYLFR